MSAAGDHLPAFQLPRGRTGGTAAVGSPEERAQRAIERAVKLKPRVSARERMYIEALAVRRNLATRSPRTAWVQELRKLIAAFPDEVEAWTFLALALANGYHPVTGTAGPGSAEAVSVLQAVLGKHPDHAGAHHYLIHAIEGSRDLSPALTSVRRLPEISPAIPHARHMPGHIYSQNGQIDQAVRVFRETQALERRLMASDVLYPRAHFAHNQHFLIHVLGLQGKYRQARTDIDELLRIPENPRERGMLVGSSAYRQGYFALIKTLVRFEKWSAILDGKSLPRFDKPNERAWYHFARGMARASLGDSEAAAAEYRSLREAMDELQSRTSGVPGPLGVAMAELEGMIGVAGGRMNKGLEVLRTAVELEDSLFYNEPPSYPRPVRETLGRVQLAARDFKGAEATYRKLERREPGSGRALWGLARALEGAGRSAEAQEVLRRFRTAWSGADADLPELR